jgi:hypothetical protein
MTSAQLQAMLAESGLDSDASADLTALLSPLAVTAADPPAASADLAALFGEDVPRPPRVRSRRRGQGAVAGVLVLTVAGVGATGLSAAANTLPHPWQRGVSHFAHHYLPFDLPTPPPAAPGDSTRVPRLTPLARTVDHPARHRAQEAHEPSRSLAPGRQPAHTAPTWSGHTSGHGSRKPSSPTVPAASGHSAQAAPASPSTVTYSVPHATPAISTPAISKPAISKPAISKPAISAPGPHLSHSPHPTGPRKHHDHTRGTESPRTGQHEGRHGSKSGSKSGGQSGEPPKGALLAPQQSPHQIPVPDPSKVRGSEPETGLDDVSPSRTPPSAPDVVERPPVEVRDVSDTPPGA